MRILILILVATFVLFIISLREEVFASHNTTNQGNSEWSTESGNTGSEAYINSLSTNTNIQWYYSISNGCPGCVSSRTYSVPTAYLCASPTFTTGMSCGEVNPGDNSEPVIATQTPSASLSLPGTATSKEFNVNWTGWNYPCGKVQVDVFVSPTSLSHGTGASGSVSVGYITGAIYFNSVTCTASYGTPAYGTPAYGYPSPYTTPYIQTTSGDVHSNTNINTP